MATKKVTEELTAEKKPVAKKPAAKKTAPVKAEAAKEEVAAVKVTEKKTTAKKPAAKKPAEKKAAEVIIQSALGGEITPEAIIEKVGAVDKVYVRVDENKAYWVRGGETGNVDLW